LPARKQIWMEEYQHKSSKIVCYKSPVIPQETSLSSPETFPNPKPTPMHPPPIHAVPRCKSNNTPRYTPPIPTQHHHPAPKTYRPKTPSQPDSSLITPVFFNLRHNPLVNLLNSSKSLLHAVERLSELRREAFIVLEEREYLGASTTVRLI
jgi:hypothetical protein